MKRQMIAQIVSFTKGAFLEDVCSNFQLLVIRQKLSHDHPTRK